MASNYSIKSGFFGWMGLALPKKLNKTVINEWVWLESQIYLGWLSTVLCVRFGLRELYARYA